jgi:hypothetical protein
MLELVKLKKLKSKFDKAFREFVEYSKAVVGHHDETKEKDRLSKSEPG